MHRNVLRPFLHIILTAAWLTLVPSAHAVAAAVVADRVVVIKSTHTMTLYAKDRVLREYHVYLGRGAGGPKQKQGDFETPEGSYSITGRNPHSSCHLSLRISYPNAADRQRARKLGVDPGGDIMIHGVPPGNDWIKPGQPLADWTFGCIAVTNAEMDEIWKLVPVGTPIEILH